MATGVMLADSARSMHLIDGGRAGEHDERALPVRVAGQVQVVTKDELRGQDRPAAAREHHLNAYLWEVPHLELLSRCG